MARTLLQLLSLLTLILGTAAQCLSSTSGTGIANYDACCSHQQNGTEVLNGIEYEYHCASWMEPDNARIQHVTSARDCVQRCRRSTTCAASAWHRSNWCYLSPFTSDLEMKSHPDATGWLAIRETRPGPAPDCPDCNCDQLVAEANQTNNAVCAQQKREIELERDRFEANSTQCAEQKKRAEDERDALRALLDRTCTPKLQETWIFTSGPKSFNITCGANVWGIPSATDFRIDTASVRDFQECADLCAGNNDCVRARVQTLPNNAECRLYRNPTWDRKYDESDFDFSVLTLL
ncbi:uncharacterized protein DSM5745_05181 [Aspergillus mulundensis]|uniref:Apple domain-containing protein n=1 Tax=Aspergillus mulundensis TaxID=1810919 RepID=A0A3D8S6I6_9EURO|nr:hypothetical protein DSM5745_05181 [Aspergillus mulundensis]RDW81624.1 hypothetical protein DSM5745_05181 [Aspergillus mulundensis]